MYLWVYEDSVRGRIGPGAQKLKLYRYSMNDFYVPSLSVEPKNMQTTVESAALIGGLYVVSLAYKENETSPPRRYKSVAAQLLKIIQKIAKRWHESKPIT